MTGRLRESLSVLADVVTVATGLTLLAASVGYAVGRLSRTGAVVILVGLAAIFGVLVYVRRRAWWEALRPKYMSAVVWLARPVKDDVLLELSEKTDSPAGGRLDSRMKRLLASLCDDQLQVYETFVEQYLEIYYGEEKTRVRAADVGFRPVTSASEMDKRLRGACEKLVAVGLLPYLTWVSTTDGLHVDASVYDEVQGIEVQVALRMVREELRSRGIAPRRP